MTRSHARRLRRARITLAYDASVATSCVRVRDGRAEIVLGEMYLAGDRALRAYLLDHELLHVARGDLVRAGVDPQRWNIASDACIHTALLPRSAPSGFVTLAALREQVAAIATCDGRAAMPIYALLPNGGHGCGTVPRPEMSSADRAAAEYARAIAAQDVGHAPSVASARPQASLFFESTAARIVRTLAERLSQRSGGVLRRVRSYARPGRTPALPGIARRRSARIAVLVDRSGSMDRAWAAVDYLADLPVEVVWIAWATTAAIVPGSHAVRAARVGSSTILAPALALARQAACDQMIIISDAELGDAPPAPAVPVIWVVVGTRAPPWGEAISV